MHGDVPCLVDGATALLPYSPNVIHVVAASSQLRGDKIADSANLPRHLILEPDLSIRGHAYGQVRYVV